MHATPSAGNAQPRTKEAVIRRRCLIATVSIYCPRDRRKSKQIPVNLGYLLWFMLSRVLATCYPLTAKLEEAVRKFQWLWMFV